VVEDNQDSLYLIDYLLRAHGYAPRLARSGADGVRLAISERPEVVLLDIRMPGMNGYEVAAAIKSQPGLESTRMVAVTASAMLGDGERVTAAGFDGYIRKPINSRTFVARVRQFLPEPRAAERAPAGEQ
jgi:CheY-like chemotaxis protein